MDEPWGMNLTASVGRAWVAYRSGRGVRCEPDRDALRFGGAPARSSGAPSVLPEDAQQRFRSDSRPGSYTTEQPKITFNLEFHYNQAGFSRSD